MPQFRQDVTTREWVIIATERAKRPDQFKSKDPKKEPPEHNPDCPFCTGNESKTPPPSFLIGDEADWKVRVIPNKFAAVTPDGEPERVKKGLFRSMHGVGVAEVIVEGKKHNMTIGHNMSDDDVENILLAYQQRSLVLSRDHRLELVTLFRNHGSKAGASLEHPHSQLIATPVVPLLLRTKLEVAQSFYDDVGSCVFCDLMNEEKQAAERMVLETEHFAVFEPFASHSPFETWIMPKRHQAGFSAIKPEEIKDLARVLNVTLGKIYNLLGDPDYNYMIHSAPLDETYVDFYHWHIQILPRLTTAAGFELGSGMFIDVTLPEDAAKALRDIS